MTCAFTLEHYRELLGAARQGGYRFARFGEAPARGDLFLRHDVDLSLEAALEVLRAAGRCEGNEVEIHCALAEALHAAGEEEGARAAATRGLEVLHAAAVKLGTEAARQVFTTLVPDNARLADIARRLGL